MSGSGKVLAGGDADDALGEWVVVLELIIVVVAAAVAVDVGVEGM